MAYGQSSRKRIYKRYGRHHKRMSSVGRFNRYHSQLVPRQRGYVGPYSGLKYSVSKVIQTKILDNQPSLMGALSAIPVSDTGTILTWNVISAASQPSLLGIAQGTAYNNRIANNIRVVGVRGRLHFVIPATTEPGWDNVRIIIYQDKQANGTAATPAQILQFGGVANTTVLSYQNWFYVDRFKILYDQVLDINPHTSVVAGQPSISEGCTHTFSIKCSIPIRYSSTTGAISEIQSDNLNILVASQTGSTTMWQDSTVRVYFKDEQ